MMGETKRRVARPSCPVLLSSSKTAGAPSLRFVQGRVRCCRWNRFYPARFESFEPKQFTVGSPVPARRNVREGPGTDHCGALGNSKGWASRPQFGSCAEGVNSSEGFCNVCSGWITIES